MYGAATVMQVLELVELGLTDSEIARRCSVSRSITNNSRDIQRLFCDACDLLDVPWRRM